MTVALSNTPILHTDRLTLRAPGPQDWPAFRDFFASSRSSFLRADTPMTEAKSWRAFCHVIGSWVARGYGSFIFTAKDSDAALGLTGPWHPIDWPEQELGWMVWVAGAEGKGYAFEAARAAREHAFRDLGWKTAVSYIDVGNARSVALAERLGAVRDDAAAYPGDVPCLVYRHPATQGAQ